MVPPTPTAASGDSALANYLATCGKAGTFILHPYIVNPCFHATRHSLWNLWTTWAQFLDRWVSLKAPHRQLRPGRKGRSRTTLSYSPRRRAEHEP